MLRDPGDSRSVAAVAERLRVDPPLHLFAALVIASHDPQPGSQSLTISELAERLSAQLLSLFACGDAELGVPPTDVSNAASEKLFAVWAELEQRFLRLPCSQWLVAARDWLELTGPAVPAAWQQSWPRLVDDSELPVEPKAAACYLPSELDLTALARRLAQARALEVRFQNTLREAKRAALKQFAYGLSHEINNPLANISTRAQTLLRNEASPDRQRTLQRIVEQTMRAHEMVADLMFYAHPPEPQKRTVSLPKILRSVIKDADTSLSQRGIELTIAPSSQEVTVVADQAMLVEAVRALVRNAIEAIGCDGRVELASFSETPPGERAGGEPAHSSQADSSQADRPHAVIVVRDSGPGLSDAARVHAFDPYFSGREAGRGLGVGLCRVERIAQLHGGDVSLQSGPAGCVARFWFPQST